MSGIALAKRIASLREVPVDQLGGHAYGLDAAFEDLSEHSSIGDFPRMKAVGSNATLPAAEAVGTV